MLRSAIFLFALSLSAIVAQAQQITVNPSGVNVSSHGATTVFLTYAPLKGYRPAEACWAGEILLAAPDLGFKPDPSTLFGCLPARYDRSSLNTSGIYTDVMSIPPSVARRAYESASNGSDSRFFYVRRFISASNGPDQFVAVTCRLTGGGARTPFSLTDVKLKFGIEGTVLMVRQGEKLPTVNAEITHTGTGRLKGRWEVVLPGEEVPSDFDLLTEASLPVEQRPLQRRYTQLGRFNVFLPPAGRYILEGPDLSLPSQVEGAYLILLRIEASDDKEGDSDLAAVGAGTGVIHSGAVAGFPLPALHYYVGSGFDANANTKLTLLSPAEQEVVKFDSVDFRWSASKQAALYKLEITSPEGQPVITAILQPGVTNYRLPQWLESEMSHNALRWRVTVLGQDGSPLEESAWMVFNLAPAN